MKYTCEIVINLPRTRVVELFDDPDNLKKWPPDLQSFEHLSGDAGQPGAKSRLVFDQRGRSMEMIETIIRRNLPEEFSGTYEAKGVKNVIVNRFRKEESNCAGLGSLVQRGIAGGGHPITRPPLRGRNDWSSQAQP